MTLFFIGHATLLYVHLSFVLMGHATVLYVLLNFALMGHAILLYGTVCSLELCTHGSCYAPLRDTICAHVVLALKLTESIS